MPGRDVEINLIGNDRTGAATRSAANNLDQLARKIDKFNAKTLGDKKATIKADIDTRAADRAAAKLKTTLSKATGKVKVKVDVDQSEIGRFRALGRRAGGVFSNAVANAINDGSRAIGNALRNVLLKSPALQGVAVAFGVRLAAFIGQGLTAGFALIGPALLAGPIAFLLAGAAKATKELEKNTTKQATLKKQLERAERAGSKTKAQKQRIADLQKELGILEQQQDKLEKQGAQWQRLKDAARGFMTFISAPLRVPLQAAIGEIERGLDRAQGPVRGIMAALGTALPGFTRGVMDAFINFIKALKPALPGIVAGMQAWAEELPKIGTALGDMVADILKNPGAVVAAVRSVSGVIQDLAGAAGRIIHGLTLIGQAFTFLETNINALESGNLGATTGFFRGIARAAAEMAVDITGAISKILGAMALLNPTWKGAANAAKTMHDEAVAQFNGLATAWAATDAAIEHNQIKAKLTADIASFSTKIAIVKQQLKDPTLSKAKRVKLEMDLSHFRAQRAIALAQLHTLNNTKSKPKLEADKSRLQRVINQANAELKKTHNKKTIAKIKADKRQAEAALASVNAQLNALNGKTATTYVKTVATYIPAKGSRKAILRSPANSSAGIGWNAALDGGAMSRTQPPTVNVAAPEVSTRVFIDGREIRVVARQTVVDETKRQNYRARVGRRP